MPDPSPFSELPADAQLRIDAACDQFEAEWLAGRVPEPDAFLAAATAADRPALAAALGRIDAEYRRKAEPGPTPPAAEPAVVRLVVTAGPYSGKEYTFDRHDTFLVGRAKDAHFRLADDPYIARRQFMIEVNPPRCRVFDLNSRNGTLVNGQKIEQAELADGDEVRAGQTVFRLRVSGPGAGGPEPDAGPRATDPIPEGAIPGYRLGPEVGRGGMGVVYRATRLADGAAVAVKTITPAAGTDRRQVRRFIREANVLQRLDHPKIVRFHEVGEAGPWVFLVMELVDGPNAEQVLKDRGPLPDPKAVRVACQVLAGLGHAHARGFVHRDVKPANVLIGRGKGRRTVKLADFGLALVHETNRMSGLTMQGEVGGTPAYAAPEQVTHYRDVKPAADQYSAAATLYRLLTGRYTHDLPPRPSDQFLHILTEPPVPIRARRADIPDGLAAVIHTALSREPEDRYPDVAAFRRALRPFG